LGLLEVVRMVIFDEVTSEKAIAVGDRQRER